MSIYMHITTQTITRHSNPVTFKPHITTHNMYIMYRTWYSTSNMICNFQTFIKATGVMLPIFTALNNTVSWFYNNITYHGKIRVAVSLTDRHTKVNLAATGGYTTHLTWHIPLFGIQGFLWHTHIRLRQNVMFFMSKYLSAALFWQKLLSVASAHLTKCWLSTLQLAVRKCPFEAKKLLKLIYNIFHISLSDI